MCYHAELGCSMSNRARKRSIEAENLNLQNLGLSGMDVVADRLKTNPYPYVLPHQIW